MSNGPADLALCDTITGCKRSVCRSVVTSVARFGFLVCWPHHLCTISIPRLMNGSAIFPHIEIRASYSTRGIVVRGCAATPVELRDDRMCAAGSHRTRVSEIRTLAAVTAGQILRSEDSTRRQRLNHPESTGSRPRQPNSG